MERTPDYTTWHSASTVTIDEQPVSLWKLVRAVSVDNVTRFLDDYLNAGGKRERDGKEIGLRMRNTHRTLQGNLVMWVLGILAGISEQEYTDARNENAIKTAKKITRIMQGQSPDGLNNFAAIKRSQTVVMEALRCAQDTKTYTARERKQLLQVAIDNLQNAQYLTETTEESYKLPYQLYI